MADGLLSNPLFLQYLSGAGSAISQGQPIGPTLNQITQQGITNQSYTKLLSKLLSNGGKMTVDKDNLAIKAPTSALGNEQSSMLDNVLNMSGQSSASNLLNGSVPSNINPSASPTESTTQSGQTSTGAGVSNPFEGLTAADLAGLTPNEISNALQFKVAQDKFSQQKIQDAIDSQYKQALIKQAESTVEANKPQFTIPGTDIKLNSKQYLDWYKEANKDERTAAIKNYEYAQAKGYKGSFEQFQDLNKTTHQKDYQAAVDSGYTGDFNQWLLEMQKAGAANINVGQKVAEKEALGGIENKLYFTSPKGGLSDDVDKYLNSDVVKSEINLAGSEDERSKVKAISSVKFIEGKITSSGATIEDVKWDGDIVTWTVKFPDGSTKEIPYAVGPRPIR